MGSSVAFLTLVVQGREVRRFVLNPTTTSIGRSQDNDIVINNLALSRRHAEVLRRSGRFEVKDLGSQNGVYVNNSRIRDPHPLSHSDTITLGTYHFVFNAENDAQESPAPNGKRDTPRRSTEMEAEAVSVEERVPLLVVKYNDVELQRLPIRKKECLIGRARECDIQIAERRLSRRHCKVYRESDRYHVADLGSQNGTYVNRKRIPRPYELREGDILNFAEYSVHYLEDAASYDGPDRISAQQAAAGARPSSGIEKEETSTPAAFDPGPPPSSRPQLLEPSHPQDGELVRPSDLAGEPDIPSGVPVSGSPRAFASDPAEPLVERPKKARARRKEVRPSARQDKRVTVSPPVFRDRGSERRDERKPKGPSPARDRAGRAHRDVEDRSREIRPERALDGWYDQRQESEVHPEEASVLLARSKSSMSQILSTMMVDKRELERNLRARARERRFTARVQAHGRTTYDGPLTSEVTILGTDDEADIRLVGRYVAGRHSLLVRVRDSLLLVRLGSSSAARVNGLPKLQAFLRSGDVIQIDETTIEIREE